MLLYTAAVMLTTAARSASSSPLLPCSSCRHIVFTCSPTESEKSLAAANTLSATCVTKGSGGWECGNGASVSACMTMRLAAASATGDSDSAAACRGARVLRIWTASEAAAALPVMLAWEYMSMPATHDVAISAAWPCSSCGRPQSSSIACKDPLAIALWLNMGRCKGLEEARAACDRG